MQRGDGELIAATVAVEALLQAIEEGVWWGLPPLGGVIVHAECLRRSLWRLGEAIRTRPEYDPAIRSHVGFLVDDEPMPRHDEHGD